MVAGNYFFYTFFVPIASVYFYVYLKGYTPIGIDFLSIAALHKIRKTKRTISQPPRVSCLHVYLEGSRELKKSELFCQVYSLIDPWKYNTASAMNCD
jgi:hypothetical protein